MSQQNSTEMKKCPYCGKMTSTKANFCYYCARELVARPERPAEAPRPQKINWWLIGILLATIVIIFVWVAFR